MTVSSASMASVSTCFGSTGAGRLEGACRLPASGDNFTSYSRVLWLAGRTWVHCDVHAIVLDAYVALAAELPDRTYVYGETGRRSGGLFKPHRTHQNGLSVDFMVPVINDGGFSVPLPTNVLNRYGYSIEFTLDGRFDGLVIDYDAIASHLAALDEAARKRGSGITRVVFDPEMQPALKGVKSWDKIADLTFSERRSWVRHDEHYHVDFAIPCESMPVK